MAEPRLAVLLIEAFADWEVAQLTAALHTYFDGRVRYLTPRGAPVTSMGGLQVTPDGAIEEFRAVDHDALVLVGSPHWDGPKAPYVGAVLAEASETGRLIAAICGATVAVARAGLLDDCRHTSNSLAYLQQNAVAYDGANYYHDGPYAVFDGNIVTAPGTAPVTFTREVLRALLPEQGAMLAEFTRLYAREHMPIPERPMLESACLA